MSGTRSSDPRVKEDTFVVDHLFAPRPALNRSSRGDKFKEGTRGGRIEGPRDRLVAQSTSHYDFLCEYFETRGLAKNPEKACNLPLEREREREREIGTVERRGGKRRRSESRKSRGWLGFSHADIVDIFEKLASPTFTDYHCGSECSPEDLPSSSESISCEGNGRARQRFLVSKTRIRCSTLPPPFASALSV